MDGLGEGHADLSLEENFRGLVVKQSKGANEDLGGGAEWIRGGFVIELGI